MNEPEVVESQHIVPSLAFVRLTFELEARQSVSLPRHTGSTLRGALGAALRKNVCVTGFQTCEGCPQINTCSYGAIWEAPPTRDDFPARYGSIPKPYVIEPVDHRGQHHFVAGERVRFRLKLFGNARNEVPHIILAMRDAARKGLGRGRGRLELVRATAETNGDPTLLYDRNKFHKWETLHDLIVEPVPTQVDEALAATDALIRLRLITPLQLKSRGELLDHIDLVALSARLTERLDAMALAHEDIESNWDFMGLRDEARQATIVRSELEMERFERYSSRAKSRVPMTGLLGTVTVKGCSARLIALWRCAEHIHVGKQATFGFGQITLEFC